MTSTGIVECREALAFPGDLHTAVLLRRIVAVRGDAEVHVRMAVHAGFGAEPMRVDRRIDGGLTASTGALRLRWNANAEFDIRPDGTVETTIRVAAGDTHDLVLEVGDGALPGDPADPDRCWRTTEAAWHAAVPAFGGSLADRDVRHAYAVLRGLTSASGGMVAAATMSLPERAEKGRNYDYRYAWIRDQCYTGQAVATAGPCELLDWSVGFVAERILADGTGPETRVHRHR